MVLEVTPLSLVPMGFGHPVSGPIKLERALCLALRVGRLLLLLWATELRDR